MHECKAPPTSFYSALSGSVANSGHPEEEGEEGNHRTLKEGIMSMTAKAQREEISLPKNQNYFYLPGHCSLYKMYFKQ